MRLPLHRLLPAGLRWRLAAWVAAVALICTGVTFVAVYRGTGTELRNQIDHELAGDADDLAHSLRSADGRSPQRVAMAATHYIRGQPFKPTSTLLFAVVPRVPGTISTRAELFAGETPDSEETAARAFISSQFPVARRC